MYITPLHSIGQNSKRLCFKKLPEQCHYCYRFQPTAKVWCRMAHPDVALDKTLFKGRPCGSFAPHLDRCATCSERMICITQ